MMSSGWPSSQTWRRVWGWKVGIYRGVANGCGSTKLDIRVPLVVSKALEGRILQAH
jgi:hypothetical protein